MHEVIYAISCITVITSCIMCASFVLLLLFCFGRVHALELYCLTENQRILHWGSHSTTSTALCKKALILGRAILLLFIASIYSYLNKAAYSDGYTKTNKHAVCQRAKFFFSVKGVVHVGNLSYRWNNPY